jgi:biotin operon repressor
MSQYTNELIGVASTHQKNHKNQHKFYKSSMDLLSLLLWFQKRSDGCFASTSWLAQKLSVSERAILKTLKLLEQAGLILRSREGRRRVITCLIDCLPQPKRPKSKSKSSAIKSQKVHPSNSLYIEQELHNTNTDVDVLVNALEKEGVKPIVARSLAKRYSKQQIRAVINACGKDSSIKSKASWIVSGLSKGWNLGSAIEEPPRYQLFQRPIQAPDRSGYKDGIRMIRERLGIVRG